MANAGCINAIGFDGCFLRTLQCLDSSNIGVGVQYTAPNPLDDKRFDYITYTDKCGCQCCLTDENEILIYATQGVIKNLTLINDDTNEKVIVKWTDLFGSNRAKTVVRYKTGSYPSSPTDGTLAVEETTQNQYQTNGYGVSGLTDGTTYYFSVFALDGDGTTINVQSSSITTNFERKPDEYTRLWYKFNGNATDYSTHQQNGTYPNGTPTYDLTAGQDGAYHGGYPIRFGNLGSFNSSQTFSVMFRIKTTADTGLFWFTNYGNGDQNNFDCSLSSGQISVSVYTGSSSKRPVWGNNLADGNWHLIVIVKNGSTYIGYQDGEQKSTWSNNTTIICYNRSQIGCHPNSSSAPTTMRIDNFIVQLNALSSSYISQYWNKMKHKYGIS